MKKLLTYWLPLVAYIALIFILSSLSSMPFDPSIGLPDKLVHFCEYFVLAALTARALHSLPWPGSMWLTLLLTVLIVGALGGLDEWYQSTVPNRTPELLDWVADAAGGLLGGMTYLLIAKKMEARSG
jgi:VanZ family protein